MVFVTVAVPLGAPCVGRVTVALLFVTVGAGTAACFEWITVVLFVVLTALLPGAPARVAWVTVVLDVVTVVP